ncbi:MAG: Glu/Leu/Phe/Val family dehydrogenase, partial [Actinomycetota bacterium]
MTSHDPTHDKSLESTEYRMREAGRWLKLEDGVIETLIAPRRVLEVSIPIRRDDGTRVRFTGWRVQHNITRGPAKGGIRYHPSVNRDETVSLAVAMSLKTALMNLPLGGAKGGVAVDPKLLSERELERVTRRYVSEIFAFLGPDKDVPAPDVGTNAQVMAWVMDQYSIGIGHAVPGVVTGKPLALGGSLGRDSATGRGVVEAASLVCQANGTSLEGKRIVIQGFGNVGMWAARLAAGWGAKIVGVSDVGGVIASEKGLDVQALVRATQNGVTSVVDAGVGEVIARGMQHSTDVFMLPSDIAMPCALGGAIDKDEATALTAK